jgi:hypothetical protein
MRILVLCQLNLTHGSEGLNIAPQETLGVQPYVAPRGIPLFVPLWPFRLPW